MGVALRPFSHLFPFPNLRTLHLSSVMVHSIHDITRLIAAFPHLSVLVIDRALWWQDNSSAPLGHVELEAHSLLCRISAVYQCSRCQVPWTVAANTEVPCVTGNRQFGWTTYVADEKRLLLGLLRDSAPSIKVLDLVTRYDSNLFSDLDGAQYVHVRDLNLMLAASSHDLDAFCPSLPPFLTQLDATHLRSLTLGFSLFRPTNMYWTFVDWAVLDDALVQLHARNPR
ncbi:uncharacterized protein B0H18DRAFT_37975 [Fomitopsis serialis]|uniref:uncharacterized protein n=1 Tax=Fomitopsis serialis TaxID=139415 RepID=UPI00200808E9|nr:uncharacterized protein B0H18DRAFT_37975 [Neoantrodia serialis]KAH9917307.1 hypothetical protein B0H18DRAFT_37975 [Neoantrodia serialis]